ncbi:tyrosine-type recombinase/integrase [Dysgonomonas sp. GY75]|uniref:tyrosine-type recombinase/integrase n=1 Tax=Dysgonomonas sp. GY75 TaxID=2780419 RepID=UPI0018836D06|nr:tyrosine-type recombinase/integrase [Dysgonomonas sp. GY75]MBF0648183.1 tyrosine-type recombinase/integrase [Dysgonomonas sp. GY75]
MDVSNLQQNYPILIRYLKEDEYSKAYIGEILTGIRQVLREATSADIKSYEEYFEFIHTKFSSKSTLHHKYKIIGKIKQFDLYGILPKCNRRSGFLMPDKYSSLSIEYKHIIDNFVVSAKLRGVSDSYLCVTKGAAVRFFYYQQSLHYNTLTNITENSTLSYFNEDGRIVRGYHVMKQVKAVLKENLSSYPDCQRIISYLPALRNRRKIYPFLEKEELDKLKNFLDMESPDIPLRDRTILIMTMYTGLRGCDIRTLNLDNIDWANNLIHIVQSKTDNSLMLPLRPVVGNAIWDYIEYERPETDCQKVFITTYKIKKGLTSSAINQIVQTVFKKINIRPDGGKIGLHLFRHSIATKLLANGVQAPIITDILGHDSPVSLETYLATDLARLKECALSIERYSVRKGVFDI